MTKSKDFILTPVIFQLDAGKKGILRVMLKKQNFRMTESHYSG